MSIYFFVIFEVHSTLLKYNVCLEENMDLSSRLISGTKSKHTEPTRRTNGNESRKNKNYIIISHPPQYGII